MTTTELPNNAPPEGESQPDASADAAAFEDLKIDGEELVAKVRELIHEGNVRRIIIKNAEGTTLIEIPLTLGVVGAVMVPTLAAVGAIAAVITDCSISVERHIRQGAV
jgi:hypothetical protein